MAFCLVDGAAIVGQPAAKIALALKTAFPAAMEETAFLVLGAQRSDTSATSPALSRLGVVLAIAASVPKGDRGERTQAV